MVHGAIGVAETIDVFESQISYNDCNDWVGNLAQLVRASAMYCWRLGALFQGPGLEFHQGVLFISHQINFW